MSQHDYVLENQSGANFRADLNNALGAIVTNNSGATEPAPTFAAMWWPDTTSGWLKQRNSANSAWIKKFPLGTGGVVDVASASTVDLTSNSVNSDYIRITGTTTISAITLEEGQKRTILAGGAFTLTNSASLIVSSGSNFTAAAGNLFYLYGEAAGVVRVKVDSTTNDLIRSTLAGAETVIKANGADVVTIGATGIKAGSYAPLSVVPADLSQKITLGTTVATTSGTSIDITGIPSWAKRVVITLYGVSTNGGSIVILQCGTSGGVVTTGYNCVSGNMGVSSAVSASYSQGFGMYHAGTGAVRTGNITFVTMGGNVWTCSGTVADYPATVCAVVSGGVTLASALTTMRLTTVNGTDVFDAGSINIVFEG